MHNDIAVDTAFQCLGLDWRTSCRDVFAAGKALNFHRAPKGSKEAAVLDQAMRFASALDADERALQGAFPNELVQWQGLTFVFEEQDEAAVPAQEDESTQPAAARYQTSQVQQSAELEWPPALTIFLVCCCLGYAGSLVRFAINLNA
jgi:hypothetical protein